MEEISNSAALKQKISDLEQVRKTQELELKEEFKAVQEALKPANLVKTAAIDLLHSSGMKEGLMDAGLALLSGGFSKKILYDVVKHPLKKALGSLLQQGPKTDPASGPATLKSRIVDTLRDFLIKNEKPA